MLLSVEENQTLNNNYKPIPLTLEKLYRVARLANYTKCDISYAVEKLGEAGLLKTNIKWNLLTNHVIVIDDISYEGHEFIEKIREPKIWKKTKDISSKAGAFSIKLLGTIAEKVALSFLESFIP